MRKLLIAEDEYWVRKRLETTVDWQSLKFSEVKAVENGKDALQVCKHWKPDLIITDIQMPNMTGLEFVEKIRDLNIDAQVIILTGYDEFKYAQKAIRYGVADYLLKPLDEITLLESVRTCMKLDDRSEKDVAADEQQSVNGRRILVEAVGYVDEHYMEPITMSSVADHLHLSSAYFCRIFREELGQTFTEYLLQKRMGKVKELLKDPNIKICHLARQVGFTDEQYF